MDFLFFFTFFFGTQMRIITRLRLILSNAKMDPTNSLKLSSMMTIVTVLMALMSQVLVSVLLLSIAYQLIVNQICTFVVLSYYYFLLDVEEVLRSS